MEQASCWIYLLYSLVFLIRLAQLPIALSQTYWLTGRVPQVEKYVRLFYGFGIEVFSWFCYTLTFLVLLSLRIIGVALSPLTPYLALFWISHDRGPSRRFQRSRRNHVSTPIHAFDERLVILSVYRLFSHLSVFFST